MPAVVSGWETHGIPFHQTFFNELVANDVVYLYGVWRRSEWIPVKTYTLSVDKKFGGGIDFGNKLCWLQ